MRHIVIKNLFVCFIAYMIGCVGLNMVFLFTSPISSDTFSMKEQIILHIIICMLSYIGFFRIGQKRISCLNGFFNTLMNCLALPMISLLILFCVPSLSFIPLYIGYLFLEVSHTFFGYLIFAFPIIFMMLGIIVAWKKSHMKTENTVDFHANPPLCAPGETSVDKEHGNQVNTGDGPLC